MQIRIGAHTTILTAILCLSTLDFPVLAQDFNTASFDFVTTKKMALSFTPNKNEYTPMRLGSPTLLTL